MKGEEFEDLVKRAKDEGNLVLCPKQLLEDLKEADKKFYEDFLKSQERKRND